jgi:T5SS/PEP-CTERM-associated repeat protein
MAASTWLWNGSAWTLESGPGNSHNAPTSGDTAIIPGGTVTAETDPNLNGNIVEIGGTAGPAVGIFPGDQAMTFADPTFDALTLVDNNVPGQTTAEQSILSLPGIAINEGTILADGPTGSTFTIELGPNGTLAGTFVQDGTLAVTTGNTLFVTSTGAAVFDIMAGVTIAGGTAIIDTPQSYGSNTATIDYTVSQGGLLEIGQSSPTQYAGIDFEGTGTLKLDQASNFDGDIGNFQVGDTLDLGQIVIGTIEYANDAIIALGTNGTTLFTANASNLSSNNGFSEPLGGYGHTATFTLGATGGTAAYITVTQGNGGDAILTATTLPGPSEWTWLNDASASIDTQADWAVVSGPGNAFGVPMQPGDSVINPGGTINLGTNTNLPNNRLQVGGTAGIVAALVTTGDFNTGLSTTNQAPTIGTTSVIESAQAGVTASETTELDAQGVFANEGSILANAAGAGSVFTIDISATTVAGDGGTQFVPGYFFNAGTILATTGNTVVINVGATSALYNTGSIVADGGTVIVNTASNALWGGVTPVRGFEVIEGGGTLITEAATPSTVGSNGTRQQIDFADSTPGNTLKIENLSSFSASISGFTAGDTIDLGSSLAVNAITYSNTTNILAMVNAGGTTVASLLIGNTGTNHNSGTFTLTNGTADGFVLSLGIDGDTILTTPDPRIGTTNLSGAWQSGSVWASGTAPATTDHPSIGIGATQPFTLTTGSLAVMTGGFGLNSSLASLDITSALTVSSTDQLSIFAGTVAVVSGGTLFAGAVNLYDAAAGFTIAAGSVTDLGGRVNPNPEPVNGVYSLQPGGNPYALSISGGTAVIDGTLIAGPTQSQRGGGVSIGNDGDAASAVVFVNAGAAVSTTHTTIGSGPGAAGTLIVNGGVWNDQIDSQDTTSSRGNMTLGFNDLGSSIPVGLDQPGPIGPAILVIENGGTVNEQVNAGIASSIDSEATAVVQSGGVWNIGSAGASGGLGVGSGGAGLLEILAGGTVNVFNGGTFISGGTSYTSGGIGIGQNAASSTGTILISGAGALLNVAGGISDGKQGQGFIDITNGGGLKITSSGLSVGAVAGSGSSGGLLVGGGSGASVLTLTSAASGIGVGNASGDSGLVNIIDGGTIIANSATNFVAVGNATGANGTLILGGTTASAILSIGTTGLIVGNTGNGNAIVNAGGTIAITGSLNNSLTVGQNSGGRGSLIVDGGLVTLGTTTTGMFVGMNTASAGSVLVENNGTIQLLGSGLLVGNNTGASGTVTVSGSGSFLQTAGTAGVTIARAGSGTLTVTDGATLSGGGALMLGGASGGQGTVNVNSGTLAAGSMNIGNSGTGVLNATAAAVTAFGPVSVGVFTNSNGVVSLQSGSTFTVQGGLEVGVGGTGTLTASGGSLSAAGLSIGGSPTSAVGSLQDVVALTSGADATITAPVIVWAKSTLSVDSTSAMEIGFGGSLVPGAIDIQPGGTLGGGGVIQASVIDNGQIVALPNANITGTLEIVGNISGSGSIAVGGSVLITGTLPANMPLNFSGADANLTLNGNGGVLNNDIGGFVLGDTIFVNTAVSGTFVALGSTQVALIANGFTLGVLGFTTAQQASDALAGTGGTLIDNVIPCFAAGTRIRTDRGDIEVENLREGDAAWSELHQSFQPVIWIGHRVVDCARHPAPRKVWPVRIEANAFGPTQPERDLYVSPDHALYIDGVLVPAKRLVNGTTIQQIETETVAYYHVELRQHDVLLAEGLPAESYLDTGDRTNFANGGAVVTLHPTWGDTWELEGCAPLVVRGALLDAIRRRLAA